MNTRLYQFFGYTISICTDDNGRFASFSLTKCKACVVTCDTQSEKYQEIKRETLAIVENDDFQEKLRKAKEAKKAANLALSVK